MSERREFVAIDLPDSVKDYLASLYDFSLARIRWTPKENLHITIRFLGDLSEQEETALLGALGKVHVSPFTLMLGGIGVFPSKGDPKVIWVGLDTGHPLLFQLRQQIDDAVLRVGIDCEMRDFVPHITIGRCSGVLRETVKALASSRNDAEGPLFSVREFALFESRSTARGGRYLPVECFPLERVCLSCTKSSMDSLMVAER